MLLTLQCCYYSVFETLQKCVTSLMLLLLTRLFQISQHCFTFRPHSTVSRCARFRRHNTVSLCARFRRHNTVSLCACFRPHNTVSLCVFQTSQHCIALCVSDITTVCILEGFQNQGSLQVADRILKALGRARAKEAYKVSVVDILFFAK